MITWSFPSVLPEHRLLLETKCFTFKEKNLFVYFRNNGWLYIQHNNSTENPFAICVVAKDLDPQKYHELCGILNRTFQKSADKVGLVKQYLNVFVKGVCSFQENGTLITQDFKNYKSQTKIQGEHKKSHKIQVNFTIAIINLNCRCSLHDQLLLFKNRTNCIPLENRISVSHFCFILEVIKAFGLEIIMVYVALLLKKRIFVYHSNLEQLQEV